MHEMKVKRIEEQTGEEKIFNSMKEAAKATGCASRSIGVALEEGRKCKGYKWELVNSRVFERWMVQYIIDNYTGKESVEKIAKHLGRTKAQVRNKIDCLGIKERAKVKEEDQRMQDFYILRDKVIEFKKAIKKGSTVKVAFYAEDPLENCNKTTRIMEVKVDGAYPSFINVLINGIRRSYTYDEVLEVIS